MFEITRSTCTLFGLTLHWYGLLIAAAVLLAVFLCTVREKRFGLQDGTGLNLALVCVPAGIVFARAYYVAFNWKLYAANPVEALYIWQGGLAVYGGIIGGAVGAAVYAAVKRIRFLDLADLVAPALALGQCIGRWGNFLNQEAYGAAVRIPALQFFPVAVQIEGSGWHCATFFYESLWCALIVCALLTAERRHALRRSGDGFFWYAFLYAAERMIVEGLRTDSLYFGPVRISQLLSLIVLLALSVLLVFRRRGAEPWLRIVQLLTLILTALSLVAAPLVLTAVLMLFTLGFTAAEYRELPAMR